ncbi:MAG: hypothetical protein ACXVDK_17640 [Bacteroidia bacterium]
MILLIVIGGLNVSASVKKDTLPRYDSSSVTILSPDQSREKNVFADKELHYKQAEAEEESLLARFLNWLAEKIFGGTNARNRHRISNFIIWALVIAITGVAIWLMTRTDFVNFVRGNSKPAEFNFTDLEEDIKGINFDERIRTAVKENNLRLAIRWYYLKELNLLNTKGWIEWQTFKTNIDYTNELQKTAFIKAFKQISRIYDYVWYGKYEISPERFSDMETVFTNFEKEVGNV